MGRLFAVAVLLFSSTGHVFAGYCEEQREECLQNCNYGESRCEFLCRRAYEICVAERNKNSYRNMSTPRHDKDVSGQTIKH